MKIHEFYYDEDCRNLYVEFSTKQDSTDYYRILELDYNDILYYSPEILDDYELKKLTKHQIIDIINQYLTENDLPEQLTL